MHGASAPLLLTSHRKRGGVSSLISSNGQISGWSPPKGGTYKKWGFDDEFLLELNPDLVIVHVSGYGEMGEPDYVRRPSYDPIAQAFSGFMYINSPRGTKPMAVFPGIGDFITALFALWSSLAALLRARDR